jgi:WD40 repeat protein
MTTNVPGSKPLEHCTAVFDAASRRPITTVRGHPFKFAPNGLLMTRVGDSPGTTELKIWKIEGTNAWEQMPLTTRSGLAGRSSYAFSPRSTLLAARCKDRSVAIWSLERPAEPRLVPSACIGRLAFTDHQTLITGADKAGVLECWDANTLHRLPGIKVQPLAEVGAVSPDGRLLATIEHRFVVEVWDLVSRRSLMKFHFRVGWEDPVAFSPDGKTLVGGDIDGKVYFWNIASGSLIATLPAHTAGCRAISFSPAVDVSPRPKWWTRLSSGPRRVLRRLTMLCRWLRSVELPSTP